MHLAYLKYRFAHYSFAFLFIAATSISSLFQYTSYIVNKVVYIPDVFFKISLFLGFCSVSFVVPHHVM